MIGTDVTGTFIRRKLQGIYVVSGPNTIGGTTHGCGKSHLGQRNRHPVRGLNRCRKCRPWQLDRPRPFGAAPLGNNVGVYLAVGASNNTIGGIVTGQGNVISSNVIGVELSPGSSPAVSDNLIAGNKIGTDPTGTLPLGNQTGVDIFGPVTATRSAAPRPPQPTSSRPA